MSRLKEGIPKGELKILKRIYWRSQNYGMLWSYSRWCGNATTWILYPFINWLYPDSEDKERKIAALKREQGLMNINPQMAPIIYSLFMNMEKEAAKNPGFDVSSIAAIRAALQGPLSGIGDSIFWVTWRLVSAGVALPLCMSGNAFGPLLFFLLFNIPSYIVRYVLLYSSYKMGDKIITQAEENNIMSSIIRAASIVGLIMVGYMVAANVAVPLNVSMTISDQTVNILEMIDGIVPGILSLGLTYVITRLLKKRVKIIYIFLGIFVIGILGAAVNIF
ncbi:PTS system mannose/fructose/sorbose family transporter subunit IID [Mediterraneibacter sp. ICN-202921]|uniref:PTS system mannose/fructose/sorbose family transporter subunit IID n=1 Tax=Mediterraneibacter sp. ICN-202921 TaxID=3134657 RepID=UPI0030BFE365